MDKRLIEKQNRYDWWDFMDDMAWWAMMLCGLGPVVWFTIYLLGILHPVLFFFASSGGTGDIFPPAWAFWTWVGLGGASVVWYLVSVTFKAFAELDLELYRRGER